MTAQEILTTLKEATPFYGEQYKEMVALAEGSDILVYGKETPEIRRKILAAIIKHNLRKDSSLS